MRGRQTSARRVSRVTATYWERSSARLPGQDTRRQPTISLSQPARPWQGPAAWAPEGRGGTGPGTARRHRLEERVHYVDDAVVFVQYRYDPPLVQRGAR